MEHSETNEPAATEQVISHMLADTFSASPPAVKGRLLRHLLQGVGVLPLVTVASGVFAKWCLRDGHPDLQVPLDEVRLVQPSDVAALVDYLQQTSVQVIDGLGQWMAAEPLLASSAAATLLVLVLQRRARARAIDEEWDA